MKAHNYSFCRLLWVHNFFHVPAFLNRGLLCPEGTCTNGTQVPCEMPSLHNPTTRKGFVAQSIKRGPQERVCPWSFSRLNGIFHGKWGSKKQGDKEELRRWSNHQERWPTFMKQVWTKPVWLNENKNIIFGSTNILNLAITWMTELILSNPFPPKRSQRKKILSFCKMLKNK